MFIPQDEHAPTLLSMVQTGEQTSTKPTVDPKREAELEKERVKKETRERVGILNNFIYASICPVST